MKTIRRNLYKWMVNLHPAPFRARFGPEMLSIYDESKGAAPLLRDAAVSILRQRLFRSPSANPPTLATGDPQTPLFATAGDGGGLHGFASRLAVGGAVTLALFSATVLGVGKGRLPTFVVGSLHPREQVLAIDRESMSAPSGPTTMVRVSDPAVDPLDEWAKAYFALLTPLAAIDRNGDRILDPRELDHASEALAKLDTDGNGFLDARECGQRFGDSAPHANAVTARDLASALIRQFDRDGDGGLIKSELPERLHLLHSAADANGDGRLTRAELEAHAAAVAWKDELGPTKEFLIRAARDFMGVQPALAALDVNGDGVISAIELRDAAKSLRTLDRNGDGALTIGELLPNAIDNETALIMRLDTDGDGTISKAERKTPLGRYYARILDAAQPARDGAIARPQVRRALIRERASIHKW